MIIYTLLFTLVGKDPAENRYIEMFYIWLSYVFRYAGLGPGDKVCILLDEKTLAQMNNDPFLGTLLGKSTGIGTEYYIIDQPRTLSEGIAERYNEKYINLFQGFTIFTDLDVLIIKSLKNIEPVPFDTIRVVAEGNIYNPDYGGHVLERNPEYEGFPGLTGAIFAFICGPRIAQMFNNIREACLKQDPPYYTIDQPFFNKFIYESVFRNDHIVAAFSQELVKNNDLYPTESVVFVNFCGGPGEGTRHHQKMLVMLCMTLFTGLVTHDQPEKQEEPPSQSGLPLKEEDLLQSEACPPEESSAAQPEEEHLRSQSPSA